MQIKEIENKDIWESFLLECQEKTFLDSWNWGEFQKKTEDKIWRLGIYDSERLIALVLVVKIKARRGTFLFLPHGPNIKYEVQNKKHKIIKVLINKLKELAKQEKAGFVRVAPIWLRTEENIKVFKDLENFPALNL